MISELTIAVTAMVISIMLALLLLARGVKHLFSANLFFIILIFCIALWSLSLGISETTTNLRLSDIFGKATYGFSGLVLYFSYISIMLLTPHTEAYKLQRVKMASLISVVVIPIFFTSFVYIVPDITTFKYGPGIVLYGLYLVAVIGLVMKEAAYTNKKGNKLQRTQVRLVAWGLGLLIASVALTNVLIPAITGREGLTQVSPVASVIYSVILVYAIARHRLFDIRLIVARSVGYILALGFLGLLYMFIAFVLIDKVLFNDVYVSTSTRRLVYTSLALISGLSFTPAKRVFSKLSDKIFYRDAYDAQVFIDSLTSIMVGNTDIAKLLRESSDLINATLKPSFTDFILIGENGGAKRQYGRVAQALSSKDVDNLFMALQKEDTRIMLEEDLEALRHKNEAVTLKSKNVAIVIKLVSRSVPIGMVLIGPKQSGNIYNAQDKKIFEIVADELSLAIENSLSYEEIQKFNETLQGEVQDATRQLRHTNEKLRALDATKDEFISMASHQLRTPLTSVKGYVSMVLEGDAGELNEQQRKLLTQAFISSQRMVYLIADLLNVSRLRTGKFVIETTPTYLPDIVEGELGQLQETAEAKNLKLIYRKPKDFPVLNLDETKIRQVIMNFADNAIYYTSPGGRIEVVLEAGPRTVEFKVIDNGLGVPRAEQHHLFNKFYRAENAKRARPDGTGLGLFMAKKVVIAQGGAIIFQSKEGKGSTFGFTFPRAKLEADKKPAENPPKT